jgi:aminopeptidase N
MPSCRIVCRLVGGVLPVLLMSYLLAEPAAAQRTVAPAAEHPYQPGVDILDYDIHLVLPDTGSFLRGDVTIALRRAPRIATLRLDLVPNLTVREVAVNGITTTARRAGALLEVPLTSAAGDSVAVRVRYDGVVTDGLIAQRDKQGRWTWFGDNWPNRARQWLPTVDHPSDKATVGFTVRTASSRKVVSNGTLLGVRQLTGREADLSETRWRESRPIPTYLMVIGVGPLARTDLANAGCRPDAVHRCVPQSVWVMPEHSAWLPGPFAAAPAIVSYFEELVGPFPYEKLAHLQSATRFGGMENASAIFYADQLFANRTLDEGIIAHETAHQWFGDAVTEREWGHLWLSEGFATYFAALWTRRAHGEAPFRAAMSTIRDQILADSVVATRPVLDTAQTDYLALLNANSYQKGGYVLFMLHQRLGDAAFFGGLRDYYVAFRDRNATTDDLRHALERSSGQSLRQFFDQWLTRPGVAEPAIGWAWDSSTATVSLLVLQERTRGAYELPLAVSVAEGPGVTRTLQVMIPAERRATVLLPGRFVRKPTSLAFDPDTQLLARIAKL